MSYTPTTWQTGDIVTADKLNNIENGIVGVETDVSQLKSEIDYKWEENNKRFVFSDNLYDADSVTANGYISNTNGTVITYNGWSYCDYIPVDDTESYSYLAKSPSNWTKIAGVYYAFYDSALQFTHGGVTTANADIQTQSGDAYFRGSYYSGYTNNTMFGTSDDMSAYVGTSVDKSTFYIAPKYSIGMLNAFFEVTDPYYSMRVTGNRITTSENGSPTGAYIKFSSITVTGGSGIKTKTWSDFKTDTASDPYIEVGEANDKTPDTFRVIPEYGIVYDYDTNTYHMRSKAYLAGLSKTEIVVFYVDADSVPSGVLYDAWANNHKQGISKYIRTVQTKETELLGFGNKFVFAFATDCHWYFDDTAYHNYTNEMVEELKNTIGFDCYINGGDSIYYGTKFKLNAPACLSKAFEPEHENIIYCIGNHDYNGVSSIGTQNLEWMLDEDAIESLCMRKMKNITRTAGKRYYYRDFEDKKIRVIVLDTQDLDFTFDGNGDLTSADPLTTGVVRQDQLDWLCDALDCPASDWGVVVVMHIGVYDDEDGFIGNTPPYNRPALVEIFKKYVQKTTYSYSTVEPYAASGSGTFAAAKGHLVGVWSGHAHADGYCDKDGFNAIQTECGYPETQDRVVGTIAEVCVDCVCVDMDNSKVTLKRFGSGSDREYTFS